MKTRTKVVLKRIGMTIVAAAVCLVFVASAQAGITRDLIVHNYRDETIIVKVEKINGTTLKQEVDAQTSYNLYVGDQEIGTTWIYYADSNGAEIDRVPAWDVHTDFHLEIY